MAVKTRHQCPCGGWWDASYPNMDKAISAARRTQWCPACILAGFNLMKGTDFIRTHQRTGRPRKDKHEDTELTVPKERIAEGWSH